VKVASIKKIVVTGRFNKKPNFPVVEEKFFAYLKER
jgi:hypothetical protein